MDKETLLALLKEHLSVELCLDINSGSYGSGDYMTAKVKISFDGEVIDTTEDSLTLPSGNY